MKTNKQNIVEIEAEVLFKIRGGTDGGYTGGCIPEPFDIRTIFNPIPSPETIIVQ